MKAAACVWNRLSSRQVTSHGAITVLGKWFSSGHFTNNHVSADLVSASSILGLASFHGATYTAKEIREAYFRAAKRCHPDVLRGNQQQSDPSQIEEASFRFIRLTEAYESLLSTLSNPLKEQLQHIQPDEEEEFRSVCIDWLNIPAEVVEESKRCPMFRQWLMGNTDAAMHWLNFLHLHGGLAPRLKSTLLRLDSGADVGIDQIVRRRRRRDR